MQNGNTLTAAQRKAIAALKQRKRRREEGLFVIEGTRSVLDSATCFEVEELIATPAWLDSHGHELPAGLPGAVIASASEMERMSAVSTPQGVMAVCRIPEAADAESMELNTGELVLALDNVQDPGNLGTIVRVADWYGIRRIFATEETTDIYSPKAIQATMGGIGRVEVIYCDLPRLLRRYREAGAEVYGTFLDGEDIYRTSLSKGGVIVMGNEGNGITPAVGREVSRRLYLPPYPGGGGTGMESLNVAMACGITVAEFRRRAR